MLTRTKACCNGSGLQRILLANSGWRPIARNLGKMGWAGEKDPRNQTPRTNSPTVSAADQKGMQTHHPLKPPGTALRAVEGWETYVTRTGWASARISFWVKDPEN